MLVGRHADHARHVMISVLLYILYAQSAQYRYIMSIANLWYLTRIYTINLARFPPVRPSVTEMEIHHNPTERRHLRSNHSNHAIARCDVNALSAKNRAN